MGVNRSDMRIFCALVLVSVIAFHGCASKEEKITNFVSKGDQFLSSGDPVSAILEYKNALQLDPRNVSAMVRIGKAYLAQKEHPLAYGAFRSALELDPDCGEARVQAATLLAMGNKGQMALDELNGLKDPQPHQPAVDIIKARALISLERFQEAIETLSRIEGAGSNKEVQMLISLTYRVVKNVDAMEKAVEQWRKTDPKDPASYLFLAQYFMDQGKEDLAVRELEEMADADPSDPKRPLLKAQCLERLGLIKQAEAAYEKLSGGSDELRAKADFWIRNGSLSRARSELESLVASKGADVDPVIKLAQVYIDQGEIDSASVLLDRTLKEDLKKPEREKVLIAKAALSAKRNDWAGAMDLCKGVLKENQANMDAHLLLGKVLLRNQDPRSAEVHLSQVAAARPEDEDAQILLARSRLLNKNDSMAGDTLKKALEISPKSSRLRAELIRYHSNRKDFDQALKVVDKGLELRPDDLEFLKSRGEIQSARGNWILAHKDFGRIIEVRPDLPLGYMEIGSAMIAQSRFDEAIICFKRAGELENGWKQAVPALITAYMKKGDTATAVAVARREADKKPQSALAQIYLGQALELAGDLAGSEEAISRAIQLAPDWPGPYYELVKIYLKQNKLAEAISRLERQPGTEQLTPVRMQLAMLYERAGRVNDAIRVYTELLEKNPSSPDLLNNLAYIYAEYAQDEKRLAEAAELVAQALDQQPHNSGFLDTAAWIAYKQGSLDVAWVHIQNAHQNTISGFSEQGIHDFHTAVILDARGERAEAISYLNRALEKWMDRRDYEKALTFKQQIEEKKAAGSNTRS